MSSYLIKLINSLDNPDKSIRYYFQKLQDKKTYQAKRKMIFYCNYYNVNSSNSTIHHMYRITVTTAFMYLYVCINIIIIFIGRTSMVRFIRRCKET